MKKIIELSKKEIIDAFRHQFQSVCFSDEQFECASCGSKSGATFYYICDNCTKDDDIENEWYERTNEEDHGYAIRKLKGK